MGGQSYLSLPMVNDGYVLRSLQNIDSATAPLRSVLNGVFATALIGALLAALGFSLASSRSIVKPLSAIILHLQTSESTGLLPQFPDDRHPIREIKDLTSSFNRAAAAILDARDCYTSGHSHRVSNISCSIAEALGARGDALEEVRIGALLHDIGKIGIPDSVLQKPGRLTNDEFAIVKRHPEIGRKILEGVSGFRPYLGR